LLISEVEKSGFGKCEILNSLKPIIVRGDLDGKV